VDNITSTGGHIASSWEAKGKCLPFTTSYVYLDVYQSTVKSVVNGKAVKPASSTALYFFFQLVTECTAESAKFASGYIFGYTGTLVLDASLNTGSFHSTYPNSTLVTQVCDVICYNSTSDDDAGVDDQVSTVCNYSSNCTQVESISGKTKVDATWKATAPAVNTTITSDTSAIHYHNTDVSMSQQRLAAATLSVKIGGTSIKFPQAAKLSKSGYIEHGMEQLVDNTF
jgi:hypothetical protein